MLRDITSIHLLSPYSADAMAREPARFFSQDHVRRMPRIPRSGCPVLLHSGIARPVIDTITRHSDQILRRSYNCITSECFGIGKTRFPFYQMGHSDIFRALRADLRLHISVEREFAVIDPIGCALLRSISEQTWDL